MNDIAHLGPVELLTPTGEESLRFFVDTMGMEVEHQEGAATDLRGWGDYQPWSLKLIESHTSGMGVLGLRAAGPEALQRRVAAVEATGLGEGWVDGDRGHGPAYRFRDHLAFWVDTREECLRAADIWLDAGVEIEAAPSKHAIAQGFFLYEIEPGGNRIEVTTGGRFVYAPDEPCVVWTEAERAKGQAWGVQTVESFHTYGTPPV